MKDPGQPFLQRRFEMPASEKTFQVNPPKPRRKAVPTAEQLEAREAKRVERLRKSFVRVTTKAKSDITKALKKGKPHYEVESRVPVREACFADLYSRLQSIRTDARASAVVMPLWDEFTNWATGEKLDIKLQPRGFGVGEDARWYVSIRAEPLKTRPVRPPKRSKQPFGRIVFEADAAA
jgi:hypothetical protein